MKPKTLKNDEYGTPRWFYEELNRAFHFTLDVCASERNFKHRHYWTIEDNAFQMKWTGERCFMNPPYSNPEPWVKRAYEEVEHNRCPIVVALVRLDPGAKWFRWIEKAAFQWNPPYRMRFEHSFTKRPMGSYGFPVTVAGFVNMPTAPPWRRVSNRGG